MASNFVPYSYLEPQSRKIICNVYHYFIAESRKFSNIENGYFKHVRGRLARATGVSDIHIARVLYEASRPVKPLKNLVIKRKDIFTAEINKCDRTDTELPLEKSSTSGVMCTYPKDRLPNKATMLETLTLQTQLDEPITVDTDSDESSNDLLTRKSVDNTNSMSMRQTVLPELSRPNLTNFMSTNPSILEANPPSELPKLIKYGPSRTYDEMNNNYLSTSMNPDSRNRYLAAAMMCNLPPLVRCPISQTPETPTVNQTPISVRTDDIMTGGTAIDIENNDETPCLALSPAPLFISTNYTATTNTGILPTNAVILPTNSGILPSNSGILSTDAGLLQTNVRILPTNAGILPTYAGTLPINSGILSTDAGILQTNSVILPTNTGILPTSQGILNYDILAQTLNTENDPKIVKVESLAFETPM